MKPLRILFLVGRDPAHPHVGGGDVQAWHWARWASEQGHAVVFISQSAPGLPRQESANGIHIRRLGTGIALAWRAWKLYRRHHGDFDLVYEDPIGAGRTPYLSPLYARVPVVVVWHQVTADLLRELHSPFVARLGSVVERGLARIYRRCNMWTPSKESSEELVRSLRFDQSRIHVIPPTIPANSINALDQGRLREPVALFLGVIRRYKSIDHLISAMRLVVDRVPNARLVVAGRVIDTAYAAELIELADRLDLSDHVEMRYSISEDEKLELLGAARVLVLPSVLEGFGIVTMEANAVGTPVVASTGVPHAAVEHGVNGFRYEYGDVEDLADCVVRILDDDALRGRMATTSIDHAARFTTDEVGSRFDRLLDLALGGNSA